MIQKTFVRVVIIVVYNYGLVRYVQLGKKGLFGGLTILEVAQRAIGSEIALGLRMRQAFDVSDNQIDPVRPFRIVTASFFDNTSERGFHITLNQVDQLNVVLSQGFE